MATRKKSNGNPASGAGIGTSLTSVEKQLAERIRQEAAQVSADTSNIIKVSSRGFSYQGESIGTVMDVIVLGSVFENTWFDSPFDPDSSPQDPVCWAVGQDSATIAPPEGLVTKENDTCNGCPHNEWGSANNGKGKACRNGRRVAIVAWAEGAPNFGEVALLRLAPTSLVPYNTYLRKVTRVYGKSPVQFVTRFEIDETSTWGRIKTPVTTQLIEDDDILGQALAIPVADMLLDVGYSLTPERATPAKRGPKPKASRGRSRLS